MTARLPLPDVKGEASEAEDSEREYAVILAAFHKLMTVRESSAERADILEDILSLRASFLIDRALEGLAVDFDRALKLLRRHNCFTSEQERRQRDVLVAAIDNLVDFAAAEEAAMLEELPAVLREEDRKEYEAVCERYNLVYARKENAQVLFAASVAAWWLTVDREAFLTYMTQGDERVRASHLSLEGLSFRKSEFPPELIPPIEWGCRCYLVADGFAPVTAGISVEDYRDRADPVFRESLATGGRIFSPAHRYFQKPLPEEFTAIVKRIKKKFAYAEDNA